MIPKWTIVGFTGHRELKNPKIVADRIAAVIQELAAQCGPLIAISSAASGADLLFLEEITRHNIKFLLVLPFDQAAFEKDFSPAEWQIVQSYLKTALRVEEVNADSHDAAYLEAGDRTVELADVLIAVWDEQPAAGLGGTADAVEHAQKLRKPLIRINPVTGVVQKEKSVALLPRNDPVDLEGEHLDILGKHFRKLDRMASHHIPRGRHLIVFITMLHLVAVIFGSMALVWRDAMTNCCLGVETLCIGAAIFLGFWYHKRHGKWNRTRIEAEICRSIIATWDLSQHAKRFTKINVLGFEEICKNVWLVQCSDKSSGISLEKAGENYRMHRIKDQIEYFKQRAGRARRWHKRVRFWIYFCMGFACFLPFLRLMLNLNRLDWGSEWLEYACLILPMLSACTISIALTYEFSRRAARGEEMCAMLQQASRRLKAARTWNGVAHIATETEEQFIRELVEWYSFSRFAREEH